MGASPSRREMLRLLLLIPVGLAWPGAGRAGVAPGADEALRLLGGGEGPRRLGRRYLELHPEERNRAALLRAVGPGTRAELRARVRADFRNGETVSLDGWVLSRTELRLCAIAALA